MVMIRSLAWLAAPLWSAAFVVSAQPLDAASSPTAIAPAAVAPAASAPQPLPQPLPSAPKPSPLAAVPGWAALTAAQKVILAPLEQDWPDMSADHRSKWLSVASRLHGLPVEEQARMQQRMRDWALLSPSERRQARIGFQAAQQLGVDERQAKWEAYQALPAEKRAELAEKAVQTAKKQASPPAKTSLGAAPKSNLLPPSPTPRPTVAVAASLLQAKPGASTVLMTRPTDAPSHQAVGQPKVIADPALVDSKTLLPKSLKAPARTAG